MTSKDVLALPLAYSPNYLPPRTENTIPQGKRIRFVITGAVERARKNYELVLSSLKNAPEILSSIELVLLGNASGYYGKWIRGQAHSLEELGMRLISYDSYIPSEEFESIMQDADCLISPVEIHTSFNGSIETYGETKFSGAVCDMVQYAIPSIVPKKLKIPPELKGGYVTYANPEELIAAVRIFLDPESRRKYRLTAVRNSQKFALERVCTSFPFA